MYWSTGDEQDPYFCHTGLSKWDIGKGYNGLIRLVISSSPVRGAQKSIYRDDGMADCNWGIEEMPGVANGTTVWWWPEVMER